MSAYRFVQYHSWLDILNRLGFRLPLGLLYYRQRYLLVELDIQHRHGIHLVLHRQSFLDQWLTMLLLCTHYLHDQIQIQK